MMPLHFQGLSDQRLTWSKIVQYISYITLFLETLIHPSCVLLRPSRITLVTFIRVLVYCTPCLKNCANLFCQNFVKYTPILIIFGRKMAKRLKLYEVHSFYTSPNSLHHTTVLNADVPNCYSLKVVICNKPNDLVSTQ